MADCFLGGASFLGLADLALGSFLAGDFLGVGYLAMIGSSFLISSLSSLEIGDSSFSSSASTSVILGLASDFLTEALAEDFL